MHLVSIYVHLDQNEEIEAWSKKYPEDAAIVETIATKSRREV